MRLLVILFIFFFQNTLCFSKDSFIGIKYQKNETALKDKYFLISDKGILITTVFKGSPADLQGLKAGDIIVSADNKKELIENNIDNFNILLRTKNPGDIIELEILKKNNEIKIIKLKLGDIKNSNLHKEITAESEAYAYYFGVYYLKYADEKINKIYLNESFAKKYLVNNPVIICLDKKSSAYKNGLKLYDEIIEINGKDPNLYIYTKDVFTIKVKRENQIVNLRIKGSLYDGYNSFHYMDLTCTEEFSNLMCDYKLFTKGTKEFDINLWLDVFECYEKNKVFTISFLEKNEKFDTKLEMLYFILGHYKWHEKDNKIYQKYIDITNKELDKLSNIKKKYPDLVLSKNYVSLVDMVGSSNLYSKDLIADRGVNIDSKNTINRHKEIIDEIFDKKKTTDLTSLKLINGRLYNLINLKETAYLEKILPILIKDNYNPISDEHITYILSFYDYLGEVYLTKRDVSALIKLQNQGVEWALKLKQGAHAKVAKATILTKTNTKIILLDPYHYNKNDIWKLVDNYLSEFDLLSLEEQDIILKIDKDYLFSGYFSLAVQNSMIPFNKSKLIEYPLKALSEIEKRKKSEETKMYVYQILIISAGLTNDDFLLNKTLLDIKKFLSVSKGKNQSLVAIKNSFSILSIFYRNKLLHKELENLVTFLENNFKIKTSGELTPLEAQEAFFYLTAKSEVAKFKQNYKDAQKHLDTLIKISDFDIPVILKEIQNDKNSVSYLQSVLITETLPELFYLYNKNSDYEKMKALTRIALRQELDDLSKRNLKDILVVNNQMKILNALFDYYKGNKKKQLMVANFIYDNLDEISKTKTFGYTPIFAEDFLENIEEYYSINEKELFNKIFEVANQKILENYNDPIFSSVWKSSKNDVNLVLKLLKSAELSNDEFLINKAYTTAQVIKNANDTRDIVKGYLAKNNADNNDLNLYHNLQKEIISLTKYEEASLLINASNLTNKSNQDLFNKKFEKIRASLSEVEDKLKNKNPEIFEPIKLRGVNINSIQSKLYENQAVLDYYFSQNELAIVIIKKNSLKVHFDNINNIQTLKNNIRNTLQISKTGALIPFDVKSAFKFNEIVFLNIEKYLQNIDFIYVIPSGPLNEIPLHVLPTTNSENCKNCSLIKWNLSNYTFNYLTSLENFAGKESKDFLTDILESNFKKVIKDFSLDKNFEIIKNLGNEMFGNIFKSTENKKNTEKMSNTYTYLGVGDPDLYVIKVQDKTKDKKITIDLDRFALLRSSNLRGFDNSLNIKNFYAPVEGSRKEIIETSKMLGETNSTIWLKGDATETKIKDNNLKNYNIIHFATHAEVSGAMQGLNEPFLVLTPPNEKTDKDNGLLMMNEIMQLNLNADLVLLSACNTGSTEDQYSGSYSGLAKAFFVAGAKSVLVSNWMVEDAATQKLILKFIDNSSRTRKSFAENLNLTMRELSNQNDQFSHPIFWAPFVFVGQDRVVNSPL